MKQTLLYLWYPLFQVQWDKFDHSSYQTWNYFLPAIGIVDQSNNMGLY